MRTVVRKCCSSSLPRVRYTPPPGFSPERKRPAKKIPRSRFTMHALTTCHWALIGRSNRCKEGTALNIHCIPMHLAISGLDLVSKCLWKCARIEQSSALGSRKKPSFWRILFSNHSRWGFFNQFGEFSSLAKFVGGSQEVASPFGSAARYLRAHVPHSFIIVEGLGRVGIQNTHPPSANIFFTVWKKQTT